MRRWPESGAVGEALPLAETQPRWALCELHLLVLKPFLRQRPVVFKL